MFTTCLGVLIRIISNSSLNVFQKILTSKGQRASVVNFYTYLGLTIICLIFIHTLPQFNTIIAANIIIMGILGALGNYFIIKALSIGELSVLAPINSYKPVVALIIGIFLLKEIPAISAVFAILLIIAGTFFITGGSSCINKTALIYRIMALIFSAAEAVFIKKIILLTNPLDTFVFWCVSVLLFSALFIVFSKASMKIVSYKHQIFLILAVGIMQYATNFVFSKINVSYALALFQLSTILSVFLGAGIFKEKNILRKLAGSVIMIIGAVILILD